MLPAWKQYQEEVAEFFRSIGLQAATDVTLQGIRTTHDIDVFVTVHVAGFDARWLVECKHWRNPITKIHVLGLREIVSDLGADRGILLCEAGFQSGAIEAANLMNVQVSSLSALSVSSRTAVYAARLHDLYDRTELCHQRYWNIPKEIRIAKGLRFGVPGDEWYSGARVVDYCREILGRAFRGNYPIESELGPLALGQKVPEVFYGHDEVVATLESLLARLEAKLAAL